MIKSKFDTEFLSVKVGYFFMRLGLSANAWTILSLIPAVFGFAALHNRNLPLALVLFAASAFMDVIDGAVARVTKSVSNLGAFLDGVIDRYVEFLLYLGLFFYLKDAVFLLPAAFWILLLVFGALMPTFVRAYADHRGVVTDQADLKKMGGFFERFERLLLIYVGMLLSIAYESDAILAQAVALVAVLSNLAALQRTLFAVGYKKPAD